MGNKHFEKGGEPDEEQEDILTKAKLLGGDN